jgi:hypothetical protein
MELERRGFVRSGPLLRPPANQGKPCSATEIHANRLLAIAGFTLCFLFLLAVIVRAFASF